MIRYPEQSFSEGVEKGLNAVAFEIGRIARLGYEAVINFPEKLQKARDLGRNIIKLLDKSNLRETFTEIIAHNFFIENSPIEDLTYRMPKGSYSDVLTSQDHENYIEDIF
jgi:hypothetical protein